MSFSFADRLVVQRMRLREREVAIETEQESLTVKEGLIEQSKQKLEAAQQQLLKAEKLHESLLQMDKDTQVAYDAAKKKNEEARNELADDYRKQIATMDEMLKSIDQRETKANRLNTTYKQQIEIYTEKSEVGEAKFDDYVKEREGHVATVKAKQQQDAAAIPQFQAQLAEELEALSQDRREHDDMQAKVDVYLKRLAEIQRQLDASMKTYEDAKDEKERMTRTMRAAKSDCDMAVKRAEQSRKERDTTFTKVKKMQEKLETLKTVTDRLNNMCAALEGNETAATTEEAAENTEAKKNTEEDTQVVAEGES